MYTVYVAYQVSLIDGKPFPIALFECDFDCERFIESLGNHAKFTMEKVECEHWPFDFGKGA